MPLSGPLTAKAKLQTLNLQEHPLLLNYEINKSSIVSMQPQKQQTI